MGRFFTLVFCRPQPCVRLGQYSTTTDSLYSDKSTGPRCTHHLRRRRRVPITHRGDCSYKKSPLVVGIIKKARHHSMPSLLQIQGSPVFSSICSYYVPQCFPWGVALVSPAFTSLHRDVWHSVAFGFALVVASASPKVSSPYFPISCP